MSGRLKYPLAVFRHGQVVYLDPTSLEELTPEEADERLRAGSAPSEPY